MPLVSVLVPLYNEEEFVGPLLERVLAAPLPGGVEREIIVVDDGSSDGSAETVEQLVGLPHRGGPFISPSPQSGQRGGDSDGDRAGPR